MKKSIVSLLLCCSICLSLTACGSNTNSTESTTESTQTTATDTTTEETVSTTESIETSTTETSLETTEENTAASGSVAEAARDTFFAIMESDNGLSTEEIANLMLEKSNYPFASATMVVEPGFLSGFQAEIDGFDEGCMFSPVIATIPFVGYIFKVENDQDAFKTTLEENADLRWNICTEADEMLIESKDQYVLFLMCPSQLDES